MPWNVCCVLKCQKTVSVQLKTVEEKVFFHTKWNMKQFVILTFALFGCAFSLPTSDNSCDCGNVWFIQFYKLLIYGIKYQKHNLIREFRKYNLMRKIFVPEKKTPWIWNDNSFFATDNMDSVWLSFIQDNYITW